MSKVMKRRLSNPWGYVRGLPGTSRLAYADTPLEIELEFNASEKVLVMRFDYIVARGEKLLSVRDERGQAIWIGAHSGRVFEIRMDLTRLLGAMDRGADQADLIKIYSEDISRVFDLVRDVRLPNPLNHQVAEHQAATPPAWMVDALTRLRGERTSRP